MKLVKKLLMGITLAVAASAGSLHATYATSGETTVSGFNVPESAIHDPYTDRYYVSNAGNGPGAPAAPGSISALKPDGQVINYKWIEAKSSYCFIKIIRIKSKIIPNKRRIENSHMEINSSVFRI